MNTPFSLFNEFDSIKIDESSLASFLEKLSAGVSEAEGRTAAIALISDEAIKELNNSFRGKDSATDVLSFPHEADEFDTDTSYLGDIAISLEQAQKQALENGLTLENELKQLMLHGVLHLCGYDHETDNGEMNIRELELRDKLGI